MQKSKHILIIRLSAMGDVAMTIPVVYAFAKANPDIRISFLSKPFFKPIIEAIPNVNFIPAQVTSEHKGVSGIWKLSRQLKKLGITEIADLHSVLRSKMLVRFMGVPSMQIDKGRSEKKALVSGSVKHLKPLKTTVSRYVEVFQKLNYSIPDIATLPQPAILEEVTHFVGDCTKKWLGIAPFAAHTGKQYPLDLMKEVIKKLDDTADWNLFLFGAPNEVEVLQELSVGCSNVRIVAGKLSFDHEINLINHLDIMLSMDSGNGHLAAMYGVPTVTLWGVTHPYAGFAPFKQEDNCIVANRSKYPLIPTSIYGNKVPEGYEDVMRTISPDSVVKKILSLG